MKVLVLIFLFFCSGRITAQIQAEQECENDLQHELYTKCFENLKPIAELQEYVSVQKIQLCSLVECRWVAEYFKDNKNMQDVVFKRAAVIAVLLHNEGHPVYLINGMDSYYNAQKKNSNRNDAKGLIYISIGDCLSSELLERFMKTVNLETKRLLDKKSF